MPRKTPTTTLALLSILGLAMAGPTFAQTDGDADSDGVPDAAEALLGTDPQAADTDGDGEDDLADAQPTVAANPIALGGAAAPFVISELLVENNFDPVANADAADHLEIALTNGGDADLTGLSVFYTITDPASGQGESTYRALDGFVVPAGGEARVHFDNAAQEGHFRANPNSFYVTSTAAKVVDVTVAAAGFAPVMAQVAKDEGGAETAD